MRYLKDGRTDEPLLEVSMQKRLQTFLFRIWCVPLWGKQEIMWKVPFPDWNGSKGMRTDEPLLELSMLQHCGARGYRDEEKRLKTFLFRIWCVPLWGKQEIMWKVPFPDWNGSKGKRTDEPLLELSMLQHCEVDKAPRPSISNIIWILSAQPIILKLWAVNAAALRSPRLSWQRKNIAAQDIFHGNMITILVFTKNRERGRVREVQKYPSQKI